MTSLLKQYPRRRGVVLLIVLSLLTLFVLLGVSYSIVASKYQKATWDAIRSDQQGDLLTTETSLVLDQLLFDRESAGTLKFHSLLRDLYGDDSVTGIVASNYVTGPYTYDSIDPVLFSNGQAQQSEIVMFTAAVTSPPFSTIPHYYAGRVITFTSSLTNSNVVNLSSRIVDYALLPTTPPTAWFAIEALAPKRSKPNNPALPAPYNTLAFDAVAVPTAGDAFLINGAPFNGAGAGYDPMTRNLDAVVAHSNVIGTAVGSGSLPAGSYVERDLVSLLPNYAGYETSLFSPALPHSQILFDPLGTTTAGMISNANRRPADFVAGGGMDEKWDAPDLQNMFLAMVPPTAARNYAAGTPVTILPSFHRPELVNYWRNQLQSQIFSAHGISSPQQEWIMAYPYGPNGIRGDADDPIFGTPSPLTLDELDRIHHIVRGMLFRPMPWTHPGFTGSNANFTPSYSGVDVFNNPVSYPKLSTQDAFNLFTALFGINPVSGANQPMWDVDTDKDGVPDSIWIDAGLPVITTASGRRIKRMAAIQIRDMDGSIDLNAHGNLAQVTPQLHQQLSQKYNRNIFIGTGLEAYRADTPLQLGMLDAIFGQTVANFTAPPFNASGPNYGVGLATVGSQVPRGMGFGPAEVNFLDILANPPSPINTRDRFAYAQLISGRYQSRNSLGSPPTLVDDIDDTNGPNGPPGSPPGGPPDNFVDARPGTPQTRDALTQLKHYGVPNDYANLSGAGYFPGWYASPPDVWGRSITVLDVGGQPVTAYGGQLNEMLDIPYEISLSGQYNNDDTRYTPAEIERLLRYHDTDAQNLPDRILRLAGAAAPLPGSNPLARGYQSSPAFNADVGAAFTPPESLSPPGVIAANDLAHERRQMLSGMSSHIPAPSMTVPTELRTTLAGYMPAVGTNSILDLYLAKLMAPAGSPTFGGGLSYVDAQREIVKIVPREFFRGQKFDINRWLGNGADDLIGGSSNGVVDDPVEAALPEVVWPGIASGPYSGVLSYPILANFYNADLNGDNVVNALDVPGEANPGVNAALNLNRQLYARHLFCMALLLGGEQFALKISNDIPSFQQELETSEPWISSVPGAIKQQVKHRLVVRRIAQWAINCVDFRDPDAIMTPFEFDYNPWDGWQVDGNLGTDGSAGYQEMLPPIPPASALPLLPAINPFDRGVVWGMEHPDLIITETLALHDRRVKDTIYDGSGKDRANGDPTLDQVRVPQGSLFFELYCTRAFNWAGAAARNQKPLLPRELYDASGRLALGNMAPGTASVPARPVWRIALTQISKNDLTHPAIQAGTNPESSSFDPTNTTLLQVPAIPTTNPNQVRYVYFSNYQNAIPWPPTELEHSFFNPNTGAGGGPRLSPGQYAVVGPRQTGPNQTPTYLGSQVTTGSSAPIWTGYSSQKIDLGNVGNGVLVTDTSGTVTSRPTTQAQPCVPIVCQFIDPTSPGQDVIPAGWGTQRFHVGLNITEPLPSNNYYSMPSTTIPPGAVVADFYDDPAAPIQGNGIIDNPEDSQPGRPLADVAPNPMLKTGTYLNCSAAYLQRLANPNLPYNPEPPGDLAGNPYNSNLIVNPYITIDWASIDVTVFNGEDDGRKPNVGGQAFDVDDPDPAKDPARAGGVATYFRTRQRGYPQGSYSASGIGSLANPWCPLTHNGNPYQFAAGGSGQSDLSATASTSGVYFNLDLANDQVTSPPAAGAYSYNPTTCRHTLGYLNEPIEQLLTLQNPSGGQFNTYLGEPATTIPWFTWNNRPFTNAMELMLVPSSSPARALSEFIPGPLQYSASVTTPSWPLAQFLEIPTPGGNVGPYVAVDATKQNNTFRWPFGSHLNFFATSSVKPDLTVTPPTVPNANRSPHLYRLLDYLEVPSPFVGAERWYNPPSFNPAGPSLPPYGPQPLFLNMNDPTQNRIFKPPYFAPPFNKMSRFRDPGKININTVFDTRVWDAAMGQFPGLREQDSQFATKVFLSRRGDGVTAPAQLFQLNPNSPTFFGNPFRASDSADLMPNILLDGSTISMRQQAPVNATFLRADPTAPTQPLFQIPYDPTTYPAWNLTSVGTNQPVGTPPGHPLDISRNPYFRFQPYQKMGNILTTNSNCFAVWITIGYFELEDNIQQTLTGQQIVFDTAHPDGRRLGQEVGAEQGDFVRHRAFYIIDRSIPVGFKAGNRLNTDDCILVKRLID